MAAVSWPRDRQQGWIIKNKQVGWGYFGAVGSLSKHAWGSVLVLRGVMDRPCIAQAIGHVKALAAGHRHLAGICDYRGCDLRLNAAALLDCSRRSSGGSLDWPTALVVREDQMQAWRTYAQLQGMAGNLRGVFVGYEPALSWAVDQAGLRLAQIRARGASR